MKKGNLLSKAEMKKVMGGFDNADCPAGQMECVIVISNPEGPDTITFGCKDPIQGPNTEEVICA